jgi:hypothetical protein
MGKENLVSVKENKASAKQKLPRTTNTTNIKCNTITFLKKKNT